MNEIRLIDETTTLFWFRRDLRVNDNAGLYYALKDSGNVLPIFIFDTTILNALEDRADRRLQFIHETLGTLQTELSKYGSTCVIFHGDPVSIFSNLRPKAVYANHDYEPYARERDDKVKSILLAKGITFKSLKDQVIFEREEVMKDDGKPYTVFTPYSKKWKSRLTPFFLKSYPTERYVTAFKQTQRLSLPTLQDIGFTSTPFTFPERVVKTKVIENYHKQRDYPGIAGTSRLSVHLRFGTVSIRKLAQVAQGKSDTWLNELIWREFYQMILWHFPHVVTRSFKPAYDSIEWNNDERQFKAWCEGKTGYPIVDAGMRELNQTGFMHNRVRMIVASFLTKHLLIDWRWGEAYFATKLLDFDLAANNGGWQWAAGCGCDAAPYFRVFNPYLQTEKFDPDQSYIKTWVPEIDTPSYPKPIIAHADARERVLMAYKSALRETK